MKIKALLNIPIVLLLVFIYASCSDDLNSVGDDIKPNPDETSIYVDTVQLTAKTIPVDSIYARTIFGLLGEYTDPVFGKIKSDYLSEFFCPDTMSFREGNGKETIKVDSVKFNIVFFSFLGDSISPMGMSVYQVDKPLDRYFYTNMDPKEYCSMANPIGQETFIIKNLLKSSSGSRVISTPLKKDIGDFLLDTWIDNPQKFYHSDSLKTIFPGLYITTTFGTGTLVNVEYSLFDIYYQYQGKTKDGSSDSTYLSTFSLAVTPEVIQMNHVQNKNDNLYGQNPDGKSFIKSPAGVCTEITIPLNEIISKGEDGKVMNSAKFNLIGNSELETESGMERPSKLLFINKDSINGFFENKKLPDSKTSFILSNTGASSTYANRYILSGNSISVGNIASIINHYTNLKEKGVDVPSELQYLLIPIETRTNSSSAITEIYNAMSPTSAILRTDIDNMKMPLVFSKFNSGKASD